MFFAKLVVRGTILGLAGYGAQQLWNQYRPPAEGVLHDSARAVDAQIAPAIRDAARVVTETSKAAAEYVADTSKAAATRVADSARDAVAAPAEVEIPSDSGLQKAATL